MIELGKQTPLTEPGGPLKKTNAANQFVKNSKSFELFKNFLYELDSCDEACVVSKLHPTIITPV